MGDIGDLLGRMYCSDFVLENKGDGDLQLEEEGILVGADDGGRKLGGEQRVPAQRKISLCRDFS